MKRRVVANYSEANGFNPASRADVIIASAIPATPVYSGINRAINPLFEGTDLIEKILRDAPKHLNKGGITIVSHSSVGDQTFSELAERYGAKSKTLYERPAGFRVEFLKNQAWVDFLIERGGLRKEDKRGYPYWHTVKVREISYE